MNSQEIGNSVRKVYLHNWEFLRIPRNSIKFRLNLFISCFIMVCLHGKVIVIIASHMFSSLRN